MSWFRNPLKSCRDIKNSFQLFQAYIKTSALYISLSFYFSFFLDFWYCFAWSFTFYDIPFCFVYISASYEFISSHLVCAPHVPFLRLYFPPSPYCIYLLFYCNSGKIHCLSRSHNWQLSHMPKLGFESQQWWETASSQWQSHTAHCTLYTHCVAKCALPVCCVISAALGQLTTMLFKNIVSIGYKQGISVDPHMWPIPQVMWRELLVASPIYISLRLLWLFRIMEGGGKWEGGGKEILWIEWKLILALFYSNSSSLWFINYPLIFHLMFNLKFPFLKILCNLGGRYTLT